MKRIAIVGGVILSGGFGALTQARACATCFGASDSAMAQGMNMGILSLLGVIGFVLLGVVSFFGYLVWRSSRRGEADGDDRMPVTGNSARAS